MSVLARNSHPNVLLRKVTRHTWGPDPDRVVVVAVLREGEHQYARVIGEVGGHAEEIERGEGVTIDRARPVTIRLADGTAWPLINAGCSCNVPGPLKGVNPVAVP